MNNIFSAGGWEYRKAGPLDTAIIADILQRTPMRSWVTLSTEFTNDYFDSQDLFGQRQTILAAHPAQAPVAMCSYRKLDMHLNGRVIHGGYLGELRVLPEHRGGLKLLINGYRGVEHFDQSQSFWFTSIASGNSAARRLLEANLAAMPKYTPLGEMTTFAVPLRVGKAHPEIRCAVASDIDDLVVFYNRIASGWQCSANLTRQWLLNLDGRNGLRLSDFYLLREREQIKACYAIWDQRLLKRYRVQGYRFPLNRLRPLYNIYARMTGRVTLPARGDCLQQAYIAFLAIDSDYGARCREIIQSALFHAARRKVPLALLGMANTNPLIKQVLRFTSEKYSTIIESVTMPGKQAVALDGRPVQPEIAIL